MPRAMVVPLGAMLAQHRWWQNLSPDGSLGSTQVNPEMQCIID
jgi:hypothetical protein